MKNYEQQIFNPPPRSQGNTLYEAKITTHRNKIKWNIDLANQAKAHGLNERSQKLLEQAKEENNKLEALIMSPEALRIPREMFHGK